MFFFFNDTATTEIYTLSLHDALPILDAQVARDREVGDAIAIWVGPDEHDRVGVAQPAARPRRRSEEHTSELQSRQYLVCRLLLEKKKIHQISHILLSFLTL